jgi:hypothetical protein
VSGSVEVFTWPENPLAVTQQGSVEVYGTVALYDNTVGMDPNANTVTIGSGSMDVSGTVGIDPNANTVRINSATPVSVVPQGTTNVAGSVTVGNATSSPVPVAQQGAVSVAGTVDVNGTVGIDPDANTVTLGSGSSVDVTGTVGIDPTANTVKINSTTPVSVVPQGTTNVAGSVTVNNPSSNPVLVNQVGSVNVAGTVGLATYANTVKLDTANNTVKVTNPTGQALDVNIVGGSAGESAIQPVQFTSTYNTSWTWTDAYTVPAGKILKIENVSVYAESATLWPVVSMRTTAGGVTSEHWLPRLEVEWVQQEGNNSQILTTMKYRLCTQVSIYADENTVVQSVGRCAQGGCGTVGFNVTFSGYLTDK